MPKLKTHRGAAKRFKLTASGKVRRSSANTNHILTKKKTARKGKLRKGNYVHQADKKNIMILIPYA